MKRLLLLALLAQAIQAETPLYQRLSEEQARGTRGQGYWYLFSYSTEQAGSSQRTAVTFQASQLRELLASYQTMPAIDEIYDYIQESNDLIQDGERTTEEMISELEQDYQLQLPALLEEWMDQYGPAMVADLLLLTSPEFPSYGLANAKIIPYRIPFTTLNPLWTLGSVPFAVTSPKQTSLPLAGYLITGIQPYLLEMVRVLIPCILLGTLLGFWQSQSQEPGQEPSTATKVAHQVVNILKDTINAVPRFLMVLFAILLYREFGQPIAFWMISVPLGISSIPLVADRVSQTVNTLALRDCISLRLNQGFTRIQVWKELWVYPIKNIFLIETLGQTVNLLYAETIIQYMIAMDDEALAGTGNKTSLGYMLVRLSRELYRTTLDNQLTIAFETYNIYLPLLSLLILFFLIPYTLFRYKSRMEATP